MDPRRLRRPRRHIAGNFGTGWTEASDLRENALWFGGKLSRVLDDVHIREPRDPLAEWRLDSACGRVELLFRPEQLHQARPSVGLFCANTRQWFGRFNGTLRHDDGDCVPVDGALGWIGSTARAGEAGGGQSISDPQRGEKCPRGSDGSGT